jgi:hypothetical protein
VNAAPRSRRHRTHLWFTFYTVGLLAIAAVCVVTHQWSVAATTLLIVVLFGLYTRRLWRKR